MEGRDPQRLWHRIVVVFRAAKEHFIWTMCFSDYYVYIGLITPSHDIIAPRKISLPPSCGYNKKEHNNYVVQRIYRHRQTQEY